MMAYQAQTMTRDNPAIGPANHAGLGSASAASVWRWAGGGVAGAAAEMATARPSIGAHQVLRVPREVLRMMADAAWAAGCSEEEIWIQAAREWLRRRTRDDDPPPTAPASAWPGAPRSARTWAAIDALVTDLRLDGAASRQAHAS
jgi:hypothetical protein